MKCQVKEKWIDLRIILRKSPIVAVFLLLAPTAESAVFTVTNTNNSGAGSLHQAILDANVDSVLDIIRFGIPGPAVPRTISPTAALPLPAITNPVVINGYSQTGATPNTNPMGSGTNAVLMIEIDGSAAGPGAVGLHVQADGCVIRGHAVTNFDLAGSVGILLDGVTDTHIMGNFIGVAVNGLASAGNKAGVKILDASGNIVGGTDPDKKNLIAAGGQTGGSCGVVITGQGSTDNTIEGNQFGTDPTGLAPLPGYHFGNAIYINSATDNLIGGTISVERNIISNHTIGIFITDGDRNEIMQNYIGTNINGDIDPASAAIPNGQGIRILNGSDNVIGGDVANVIARNGRGVVIVAGASTTAEGNTITQNSITRNDELGIDLGDDDVTSNDLHDLDAGPNQLQNFPVLLSADKDIFVWPYYTEVQGILHSTPLQDYRIDLYNNSQCDPVFDHGEGEDHVFTVAYVTTDALGFGAFTATVAAVSVGEFLTATATDLAGNTSEFSLCEEVKWGWWWVTELDIWQPISPGVWSVFIPIRNASAAPARDVAAILELAAPWFPVLDADSYYGDIPAGGSVQGDGFALDLTEWPGGSFLVVLNLTYLDDQGVEEFTDLAPLYLTPPGPTAVPGSGQESRRHFNLRNYPNPSNPGTTISFELAATSDVNLRIYDATGNLICTLLDGRVGPGIHSVRWDGKDSYGADAASGVYSYRLEVGERAEGGR